MERIEHGERGHLNIYTRDQDGIVTHYGQHYRVVAFLPRAGELYVRVDHKHGARMPTQAEALDVARRDQGICGRWRHNRTEEDANGDSTDYYFTH